MTLGTFWMRGFFRSTPRSVTEAARVDGAGHFRTLVGVLAIPVIIFYVILQRQFVRGFLTGAVKE